MIDVRFLTSINVALDDESLLRHIDVLSDYIADGIIAATVDRDAIESLHLTEYA